MTKFNDLHELFQNGDFLVEMDFSTEAGYRVAKAFEVVRDLDISVNIVEGLDDTWLENVSTGGDYRAGSWGFFGVVDGDTLVTDDRDDAPTILSVDEFVALAERTNEAPKASAEDKSVIVLGETLVVSGGVVVVTYKSGEQYHLYENGKATLDVARQVVITERTFTKDTQPAYERVEIKLDVLDNVAADSLKLTVLPDNKVAFTTTFQL